MCQALLKPLEYSGEHTKSKSFSSYRFYILVVPGLLEEDVFEQKEEKVQSLAMETNLVRGTDERENREK